MTQLSFACAPAALALSLLAGAASGSVFTVLSGPTPGQPIFAGDPRNRAPGVSPERRPDRHAAG